MYSNCTEIVLAMYRNCTRNFRCTEVDMYDDVPKFKENLKIAYFKQLEIKNRARAFSEIEYISKGYRLLVGLRNCVSADMIR